MRLMLSNSRANEHDLCYRCGAQMPESTRHAPNPKRTAAVHQTWRLIQRIRFLVMRVSQAQLVGTLIIEGVGPALSRRALRHSQKDCLPGKLPVARLSRLCQCVDEARAVGRADAGDVVPANTGSQRSVRAEGD